MSNDPFVKIDYLTLEVGDSVYCWMREDYELVGIVTEVTDGHVFVDTFPATKTYTPKDIEKYYTLDKNFYAPPKKNEVVVTEKNIPKKVLTTQEIYEMLTSDVSLLGLSKKAVRKIEKAILAKLENLGKLH